MESPAKVTGLRFKQETFRNLHGQRNHEQTKHGFAIFFVQLQSISFLPKKHLQLKQNDRALSVLPKIPPKMKLMSMISAI